MHICVCLVDRSPALPAVVKVVKYLLVHSNNNVPFTGGLSSYSAFLMVLAAYDRCVLNAKSIAFSSSVIHQGISGQDNRDFKGNGISTSATGATSVTEGEVLLQFFALYSSGFNPSCQGIDVRGIYPSVVDLTPEQQITIAGGGMWIVDPLTPHLNVARPSFAFRQVFLIHLKFLIACLCGSNDIFVLFMRYLIIELTYSSCILIRYSNISDNV